MAISKDVWMDFCKKRAKEEQSIIEFMGTKVAELDRDTAKKDFEEAWNKLMDENIRALLSSVITDEMIKEAVRDVVYEMMSEYNTSHLIREVANDIFKEKATGYMQNLIDEEFKKPVKKDDGWGDVEYYDSFDEFVKSEMQTKLKNSYDLRRIIEQKLDNAVKHARKRIAEKVVETELIDEVIAELQPKDFTY